MKSAGEKLNLQTFFQRSIDHLLQESTVKNILFVLSSPRGWKSYSHQFASHIVDDLKTRHPGAKVVVRDVAKEPLPHVDEASVTGRVLQPEKRSPAEAKALAVSDALVVELAAADVVVLAVPMHNFGLPSSLKAWIDHIVRPGRTFSYSEKGPEGLLKGKRPSSWSPAAVSIPKGPRNNSTSRSPTFAPSSDSSASRTCTWCASKAWRWAKRLSRTRWRPPRRNRKKRCASSRDPKLKRETGHEHFLAHFSQMRAVPGRDPAAAGRSDRRAD